MANRSTYRNVPNRRRDEFRNDRQFESRSRSRDESNPGRRGRGEERSGERSGMHGHTRNRRDQEPGQRRGRSRGRRGHGRGGRDREERGRWRGGRMREEQGAIPGGYSHGQSQSPRGNRGRHGSGWGPRQQKPLDDISVVSSYVDEEPLDILARLGGDIHYTKSLLMKARNNPQLNMLLLKGLTKCLVCSTCPSMMTSILAAVMETRYIETNIDRIKTVLNGEETGTLQYLKNAWEDPLKSILELLNKICNQTSVSAVFILGTYHAMKALIDRLNTIPNVDSSTIQNLFRHFEVNKTKCIETESQVQSDNTSNDAPTESFRTIPICPQTSDLLPSKPVLRAIKSEGKYESLTDYLDINFRLLREDFIGPLREGIIEYKQQIHHVNKRKLDNLRIYDNVRILTPVCGDGLNHILTFDISKLNNVRWNLSSRLIYGSLLCLSNDNFETCYFATVMNDSMKKNGLIKVKFENDAATIKSLIGSMFTMAETTAYFEAFRHVLSSLQQIQEGELPFQRYLVECKLDLGILPPKYLRDNPEASFDLRSMNDNGTVLHVMSKFKDPGKIVGPEEGTEFKQESQSLKAVQILEQEKWPDKELLRLDDSQLDAVKAALTKEFSVIQGPPGCGKTYIGLKIVKALLHNKKVWSGKKSSPLLIVCYTNHALDQFMEGICEFYDGDILRVGGRSKSETVNKHNLSTVRASFRKLKALPKHIHTGKRVARGEMFRLKTEVNLKAKKIQFLKGNIVKEEALYDEMSSKFYRQFDWNKRRWHRYKPAWLEFLGQSVIVEWLQIAEEVNSIHYRIRENGIEHIFNREPDIDASFRDDERENRYDDTEDSEERINEKEDLSNFMTEYIALDLSTVDEKPNNISAEKWRTARWERLELASVLNTKLRSGDFMTNEEEEALADTDIFDTRFTKHQRWRLYLCWVNRKCQSMHGDMYSSAEAFEEVHNLSKEVQMLEDVSIMQQADMIGMTITGAAKHQSHLKAIQPAIMVVEEAAEVFESHLISNLTPGCQQLILIGDHKQLRPKPNMYELEKDFNLDLSLFERMVKNQMTCYALQTQHRMRPEIADVVRFIYEDLKDNDNVKLYENVKGIAQNICFLNHDEEDSRNEEMKSFRNEHEAAFLIALCRYLMQQGYESSQITILTTYKGQLFTLKRKAVESALEGVRISVVDNYQGEENDIILLSLVRNNKDGNVGFLKIDNRVCVALSRAKQGLFVVGNFDKLAKASDLWKNIVEHAKQTDKLINTLPLRCQNHPESELFAARASDFEKAPKGGCRKMCEKRLECGHVCDSVCHIEDMDHKAPCKKPCLKLCKNGHNCKEKCCDKCVCTRLIEVIVPKCKHRVSVLCDVNIETYECEEKCERELGCGHTCVKACHEVCEPCDTQVSRVVPGCGHTVQMSCGTELSSYTCTTTCGLTLDCGHLCKAVCGENSMDSGATVNTIRVLTSVCERGHVDVCRENCTTKLACGHTCKGTCNACYKGRFHVECSVKCNCVLACSHKCTGTCSACSPCSKKCERRCFHQRCTEKCSHVCEPCTTPCSWKCDSRCPNKYRCTKMCSDDCDRPRCNRPCRKRPGRCNHDCIGLCGEPCPTKCRICNKDVITKIRYGGEDDPATRFIQLENCGHIIRYDIMDEYMDKEEDGLCLKRCPVCSKPILQSYRYGNVVKRILSQIDQAKLDVLYNTSLMNILQNENPIPNDDDYNTIDSRGEYCSLGRIRQLVNVSNANKFKDYLNLNMKKMLPESSTYECLPVSLPADSSMPTKQWMTDCEREINRCTDSFLVEACLGKSLDSKLTVDFQSIQEILTKQVVYTEDSRLRLQQIVTSYNERYGTPLQLPTLKLLVSDVLVDTDCYESDFADESSSDSEHLSDFALSARKPSKTETLVGSRCRASIEDTMAPTAAERSSDGEHGLDVISMGQFSGKPYFGCGVSKFHIQPVEVAVTSSKLVSRSDKKDPAKEKKPEDESSASGSKSQGRLPPWLPISMETKPRRNNDTNGHSKSSADNVAINHKVVGKHNEADTVKQHGVNKTDGDTVSFRQNKEGIFRAAVAVHLKDSPGAAVTPRNREHTHIIGFGAVSTGAREWDSRKRPAESSDAEETSKKTIMESNHSRTVSDLDIPLHGTTLTMNERFSHNRADTKSHNKRRRNRSRDYSERSELRNKTGDDRNSNRKRKISTIEQSTDESTSANGDVVPMKKPKLPQADLRHQIHNNVAQSEDLHDKDLRHLIQHKTQVEPDLRQKINEMRNSDDDGCIEDYVEPEAEPDLRQNIAMRNNDDDEYTEDYVEQEAELDLRQKIEMQNFDDDEFIEDDYVEPEAPSDLRQKIAMRNSDDDECTEDYVEQEAELDLRQKIEMQNFDDDEFIEDDYVEPEASSDLRQKIAMRNSDDDDCTEGHLDIEACDSL